MILRRFPPQLYLIIATSLLCHVTMSSGRVAAGLMILDAGWGTASAGLVYSLYNLAPMLLALQIGRLVDRVGIAPVMFGGQIMMLLGLLMPALVEHPAMLFLTAFASGTGFNAFMVSALVFVGHASHGDSALRTSMFSWVMLGNSVSAAIGPTLTGMVIDHAGYAAAFGVLSGVVAISLLPGLVLRQVRAAPRPAQSSGRSVWQLLRDERSLQHVFVVSAVLALAWDTFVFIAPVLGHGRGFSATEVGMVMSAFAVGTFTIRLLMPVLSRYVGEWRLITVSLVLNAAVFLAMPVSDSHLVMVVLALLFGLSTGGAQPSALSLLHAETPAGREGEAVGLRSTVNNGVATANPTVLGALLALMGVWPAFGLVATTMLAGAWVSGARARMA